MTKTHGKPSTYSNGGCRCDLCSAANSLRMRQQRERRSGRVIPDGLHGKSTTYTNYKCRCEPCRDAHKVRLQIQIANRLKVPFEDIPHGKSGYLSYGCKCPVCGAAGVEHRARRKARKAAAA